MKTTDVLIVGGGIIGCSIAYFLRKAHVTVTLLERGDIGSQASGAAAGLRAPLGPLSGPGPFADLLLSGFAQLVELVPELEDISGVTVHYEQTGALRIVRNAKRIAHLQKRFARWQPLGLQLYWLNGEEVRQREPTLASDICAGVYIPAESQLQASSLVHAFAQAAHKLGAEISPHQEVEHVSTRGSQVISVTTVAGESIACQRLVIASGAWSQQLTRLLHLQLPITPLHGQLAAFSQTNPALQHIIFGDAAYTIPRGNRILVGATKEEMGFDTSVTTPGTNWLTTTATRLLPQLHKSTLQATWAGLRPSTPDSHPIIDFLAPWENVLIASGHNSTGVMLSAITGQCVSDMVTTSLVPAIVQPFSAGRFSSSTR
jgi:glycine oxidase